MSRLSATLIIADSDSQAVLLMKGGFGTALSVSEGCGTSISLRSETGRIASTEGVSRRKARKGGIALLIVSVLIASMMVLGAGLSVMSKPDRLTARSTFLAHAPILIESDAALTAANGVTSGSGTESDPFVIEGWNVDASGSNIGGIAVSNLTSHLVIRNVYVHSDGTSSIGIGLVNISNAVIEGNRVDYNAIGITAFMCTNITIENNVVDGAGVIDSVGIFAFNCSVVSVTGNIAINNMGIGIVDFNSVDMSIEGNAIIYSGVAGVALEMANLTEVRDNLVRANYAGILLIASNWSYISENVITNSTTTGIMMMSSMNNTIYSNFIGGTMSGEGATLMFCDDNLIYHNDFIDNGASPQASDLSTTNNWNVSYPEGGNHWNDHTSPDAFSGPAQDVAGSDGIVDTPYVLGGLGAQDDYPLVAPVMVGISPQAFFNYTPATGTAPATFNFDGSISWDPDDSPGSLEVRWDWESDGTWDTAWSTDKTAQHEYALAGSYNVTMEVRDMAGHSDNYTQHLEVEGLVIPEFTSVVIPIVSMIALFLIAVEVRRR